MDELSYVLTKDFVSCGHVLFYERDSCVADTLNFLTGNITFSEIENEKRTWYLVYFRQGRVLDTVRSAGGYWGGVGGWNSVNPFLASCYEILSCFFRSHHLENPAFHFATTT